MDTTITLTSLLENANETRKLFEQSISEISLTVSTVMAALKEIDELLSLAPVTEKQTLLQYKSSLLQLKTSLLEQQEKCTTELSSILTISGHIEKSIQLNSGDIF